MAISRERNTEGGPAYVQDRVAKESSVARLLEGPRTLAYVCGIAGMELGIFQKMATVLSGPGCSQYLGIEGAGYLDVGPTNDPPPDQANAAGIP